MRAKLLFLAMSSLCISGLVHAEDYYSSQTPNGGYVSSQTASQTSGYTSSVNTEKKESKHKRDRHITFSVNIPSAGFAAGPVQTYFVPGHAGRYHPRGLDWVDMVAGEPVPEGAVIGGNQVDQPLPLFVCRANYRGGMHPGKLIGGRCNISFGGREIPLSRYQVLVTYGPLNWVAASYGEIPPRAVAGGFENGMPLYICQVEYRNGVHPGKIVGQACNIPWGGAEIKIPYYNVLVR